MNARIRILCVDDKPLNLMVLEGVLVPQRYEVITAAGDKFTFAVRIAD